MFRRILSVAALSLAAVGMSHAAIQTIEIQAGEKRVQVKKKISKKATHPTIIAAINKASGKRASIPTTSGLTTSAMALSSSGGGCMEEVPDPTCINIPEVIEYQFDFDYFDILLQTQQELSIELEFVYINGKRECSVSVSGPWGGGYASCDDVDGVSEMNALKGVEDIKKPIIERVLDLIIPESPSRANKLEKCPKVTKAGMTATSDRSQGYVEAEKAFLSVYAGALPGIHITAPVDVKYPDGTVMTFEVWWVSFEPPGVELKNPILNEKTSKEENKCV